MNRILSLASALILLLPHTVQGQEWTAEQRELWAWEVACLETLDLETKMACFHDDFVGLGTGDAEPTTKAERGALFAEALEAYEMVSFDFQPLAINLQGNTAIFIYEATIGTRSRDRGEEESGTE